MKVADVAELKEELVRAVEVFKACANPVRAAILVILEQEGELNVNQITLILDEKQSTVSQHLRSLRYAGMVKGKRRGIEVQYSLTDLGKKAVSLVEEVLGGGK